MFDRSRKKLIENEYFDANWYLAAYPDVALSGVDPAWHFLRYGQRLGRDPGPEFSTNFVRSVFHLNDNADPVTAFAAAQRDNRKPDRDVILLEAGRVADEGRPDLAIALAEEWLPSGLKSTALLLRANAALDRGDRSAWLHHLNEYLTAQDVAPLQLTGDGTLFDQFSAPVARPMVTDGPQVSVLMPAWNAEKTIEMAARSILDQTWQRLELLIVDDASTDGTWSILQRLAAEDPRVRVFQSTVNGGPYLCKNIALTQAQGAWITGHDADDWAHPERIERQVRFCLTESEPACMSGMLRISGDGRLVRFNPIGGNVIDGALRNAFISLMVDAQIMHGALGYWDETRVGADSELLHRLQHLLGRPVQTVPKVTMLCYDNPAGLTNNATLGHSETGGVSRHRRTYKKSFMKFHAKLAADDARLDFPQATRRFPAPSEILNAGGNVAALVQAHVAKGLRLQRDIDADVVVVSNLAFKGGNTSSTLDEVDWLLAQGLKVAIIHSPTTRDAARSMTERAQPYSDLIVNWSRVGNVRAHVTIIRHPVTATSMAFKSFVDRITTDHAYVVINNSLKLADGRAAYQLADLVKTAGRMQAGALEFCPISGVIRDEISAEAARLDIPLPLSRYDWLPTMDAAQYDGPIRAAAGMPLTIGRHARDGAEKWNPDAQALRAAYPHDRDFRVEILGGARYPARTLGRLPQNWTVHPFGSMPPEAYLQGLDAFVYFPHPDLLEAFGRSIAEAMLAGVPVILPPQFRSTFGDLAFYAEPNEVAPLVRAMAADDAGRIAFVTAVRHASAQRHDRESIFWRLAGTRFGAASTPEVDPDLAGVLPADARAWAESVRAAAGQAGTAA